ncbi:hypothetical protein G6F36_010527 [Rhizopus arrhizus]|nr:hypothetical protein G6F36_010527 [Rhizopus arrhizus]
MDDLLDLNWSSTSTPNTVKEKKQQQQQQQQKKDVFADLLPASNNSKSNDNTKLSLLEQQRKQHQQGSSSWSLPITPEISNISKITPQVTPPPLTTSSSPANKPISFEDLLNPFGSSQKQSEINKNTPINQLQNSSKPITLTENKDQWNFDLLNTQPIEQTKNNETIAVNSDPFDFDVLMQGAQKVTTQTVSISAEFDEDNPLGILAGPVQPQKDDIELERADSPPPPIQQNGSEMLEADEDEMLAKLIDMGFSLQQSKFALEATGGYDLQSAIDLLMQSSEPVRQYRSKKFDHTSPQTPHSEQIRHSSFPLGPQNDEQQNQRRGGDDILDFHKDKIVGQAQELGGMLYKNAASFLKLGREKVTKAVGDWQEQQRAQRLRQLQEQQKGPIRPKWMTNDTDNMGNMDMYEKTTEKPVDDMNHRMGNKQDNYQSKYDVSTAQKAPPQRKPKKDILLNDADEQVYVSPSRRKTTPTTSGRSTPQPIIDNITLSTVAQQAVPPSKPQKRTRPVIDASADLIRKVNQVREQGNEKFKLGQFGEAEEAYTRAIELLPSGHDYQVVLRNNRAMTRLKTGDYKKCIEDCNIAIKLSKESGEENSVTEWFTINWRDQLLKSLHRKSEALENIEKYKEALETYGEALKIEGPNNSKLNQGMARCRQALNPKIAAAKAQPTKSIPQPKKEDIMASFDPTVTTTSFSEPVVSAEELNNSKAVAEMRAKAAEQEAEEAERLSKTDDLPWIRYCGLELSGKGLK